jgi:glycosyltransferase involved in cell wall biosynthesis
MIEVNMRARKTPRQIVNDIRHYPRRAITGDPQIDFFASRENYVDHLLPIYNALPDDKKGCFVVSKGELVTYGRSKGINALLTRDYMTKNRQGWVVMAGLSGVNKFRSRNLILVNHGCGGHWNVNHQSYAGGRAGRRLYQLILEPGDIPAERDKKTCPHTKIEVVGCPKMDRWYPVIPKEKGDPPVIAIGFHQDTQVCPESRTALPHYMKAFSKLSKWQATGEVKIIGTGHPVYWSTLKPIWVKYGFEPVLDFDEVMERADVYVRDQYSTIYEFASLDRPVVLLNAPWYRRDVEHGMRFWELSNVGVNCNEPGDLIDCIKEALTDKPEQQKLRRAAIKKIYKYMDGKSTERAVQAILSEVTNGH